MSDKTLHTFTQEQLEVIIVEAIEWGRRLERVERARANQLKGVKPKLKERKSQCMARLTELYRWMPHGHGSLISEKTGEAVTNEAVYQDLMDTYEIALETAKKYVTEWRLKGKLPPFDGDVAGLMEHIRRLSDE